MYACSNHAVTITVWTFVRITNGPKNKRAQNFLIIILIFISDTEHNKIKLLLNTTLKTTVEPLVVDSGGKT